jgi:hypothetical protein
VGCIAAAADAEGERVGGATGEPGSPTALTLRRFLTTVSSRL